MTVKARINHDRENRDPRFDQHNNPACRDADPELFYPTGREQMWDATAVADAKAVCARCPLLAKCHAWAMASGQAEGILGGHTPGERKAIKRQADQEAKAAAERTLLGQLLAERAGDPGALLAELAVPAPIAVGDRVDTRRRKGVVVLELLQRGWFNGRTLAGQTLAMSSADVVRVRA